MELSELISVVRRAYEKTLAAGKDERIAINRALAAWCKARPEDSLETARCEVARVIAIARIEAATGRPIAQSVAEWIARCSRR